MWHLEEEFAIIIGGNTYINTPNLIVYKGAPLFTIKRSEDGLLGIDFDLYNVIGQRVAKIRKGVIVHGDRRSIPLRPAWTDTL